MLTGVGDGGVEQLVRQNAATMVALQVAADHRLDRCVLWVIEHDALGVEEAREGRARRDRTPAHRLAIRAETGWVMIYYPISDLTRNTRLDATCRYRCAARFPLLPLQDA